MTDFSPQIQPVVRVTNMRYDWKYVAHSFQKLLEKRGGTREGIYGKVFLLRDAMGYFQQ